MSTHQLGITILVIAAVIYAIVRQVMPQKVGRLQFVIFPVIAAYEAYHGLPQPTIPMNQLIECILAIGFALVAGAIQAFATRVYYKGNQLYMQGGWMSLVAWGGLIIVRFLIHIVFEGISYTSQNEWILWAAVAIAFGSRSLILYMKHPEIKQALADERAERSRRRMR